MDTKLQEKWDEFLVRTREIYDLIATGALMGWDQSTYMPPKGGAARGRRDRRELPLDRPVRGPLARPSHPVQQAGFRPGHQALIT